MFLLHVYFCHNEHSEDQISHHMGLKVGFEDVFMWPYYSNSSKTLLSAKDLNLDARHQEEHCRLP